MNNSNYPHIPGALREVWADLHPKVAHARLSTVSLNDFQRQNNVTVKNDVTNGAAYVDLRHNNEDDPTAAIVMPLPYATGWSIPQAINARMLQESLRRPMRVIAFPNPTYGSHTPYTFDESQHDKIAWAGDFSPMAERIMKVTDALKIEKIHVVGYELGATIGAAVLRLASVNNRNWGNSALIEAPNVIDRGRRQLKQDLAATNGHNLEIAVEEAKIPALSSVYSSSLKRSRRESKLNNRIPENATIIDGLSRATFQIDAASAVSVDQGGNILIASGSNSPVSPPDELNQFVTYEHYAKGGRLRFIEIEGYGNEIANNAVVFALLGKMAIEKI